MFYEDRSTDVGYVPPTYSGPSGSPTPTATTPTPAAAGAPPATVQTGAGSTPDYTGLLSSDPGYVAAQNATTLARQTADAQRRAAIRAAFIRYGGKMPSGFVDQYGDLSDQATQDAASGNQNSRLAQLATNYQQGVDRFRKGLAARGGLQSSELDYGGDQLNRGYEQQQYDEALNFTDQANQAITGYTGVLGSNASQLAGAIQGAESNVYSNPAYRPTDPTYADYDPGSSATYGTAVYKGSDGNLYDGNGNPFNPPSGSPTPGAAGGESSPYSWGFGGKQ